MAPAATADDVPLHHVRYTVSSDTPVAAHIYYRQADPPDWGVYSHDPYVWSPRADAQLGPDQPPWVFDTMLATGALLVPIGIALFGLAMRHTPMFGPRLTWLTIGLGLVGTVGAVIGVVDPGSVFLAVGVLAIVVFHLTIGWQTLRLGRNETIDLTAGMRPAPLG